MRILKILGSLAAVMIIVVILLLFARPSMTINQEMAVPSFFSSAISYNNNSLLIANGRTFVVYNYTNGRTRLLGPDNIYDYSLDDIDSLSLSSNKQFIVFHSQSVPTGSLLSQQVQAQGATSNSYFGNWFIYNTQNQQFQLLPTNVIQATAFGGSVDALSINTSGQELITTYKDNGLSQVSSINIPNVSSFFPVNGGFLLEKPNNQVMFTTNGIFAQNLYSSMVVGGISSDGNTAIGTMSSNGKNSLAVLDFKSSSYRIVASNISQQAVWSQTLNQALYLTSQSTSTDGQLNSFNLNDNKTTVWQLNRKINLNVTPITPLGNYAALVEQSKSSYFLLGNSLSNVKVPSNNYSRTINTNGQSATMQYSSLSSTLTVYDSNSNELNSNSQQLAIYLQLRKDGYNPYLIKIMVGVSG